MSTDSVAQPSAEPPTFDDWYLAKYGTSFDEDHMHPGALISVALRALAREMRDYISEWRRSMSPASH